jgi:hypothetical protein
MICRFFDVVVTYLTKGSYFFSKQFSVRSFLINVSMKLMMEIDIKVAPALATNMIKLALCNCSDCFVSTKSIEERNIKCRW